MAGTKISRDAVIAAVQRDDNTGFCLACGEETEPGEVESDGREYECDFCGEHKVYGAEELLLQFA